jgi:hypothetical protein
MARIDNRLPSNSYLKLVKWQTRRQSSLLIALRSGHGPLNRHLHTIQRAETPRCLACGDREEETVRHFLLECPAYEEARRELRGTLGHCKAGSIRFLLSDKTALEPLYKYVDRTKRFHDMLGTIARKGLDIVYD